MSQTLQDSNISILPAEDSDPGENGAVGNQDYAKSASVGSISEDVVDGWLGIGHDTTTGTVDKQKDKANIDILQRKIEKIKERLKEEQNTKEANVNEYLRVSSNPSLSSSYDKQQMQRMKAEFEKKNRRSTQLVSQLQKKLDTYRRQLKEVQQYGSAAYKPSRDFKQGLKDTGASIRDGISGFTGGVVDNIRGAKDSIVSKPKEFAHLIKNKYKSGSTGDIHNLKLDDDQDDEPVEGETLPKQGSSSLPRESKLPIPTDEDLCSDISGSGTSPNHSSPNPQSMTTSQHADHEQEVDHALRELHQLNRDVQLKTQESLETHKLLVQSEFQGLKQQLDEERYRNERLEEQLNEITELHHDLTELHQHEITNIKQELSSMEEKMEYQLEERTRDMQEMLDTCQTRITKMELQQQQQQLISMEGFENSNFRALITKLINVALALLAVVLVLVSTVVNMLGPFIATRYRFLSTIILASVLFVLYHNWDFLKQYLAHILSFFEEFFDK